MKKRILSFLLSAVMLLSAPAAMAEEAVASYYAGELTTTAVSDSYFAGEQINLDVAFGVDAVKAFEHEKLQAVADVLGKGRLHMSFYDDFGTGRIHAEFSSDDVSLLTADALTYEDGSVQIMTNLTGNLVLALPAGTFVGGKLNLDAFSASQGVEYDFETEEGLAAFKALPAIERLKITGSDLISTLINHLLGWVSFTQMESGELYVFDDTYLEATETRDPVAQRMIGTIQAHEFNTLMWNIAATICDTHGDFQQALADVLAERGVTRHQMRKVTDAIFKDEVIDPATDWVQTSWKVFQESPDALCEYDDVSYFFKKLVKCTDNLWTYSAKNTLSMDVSYDDFGGMVGFDADLKQFTELLPYEGTFNYSLKTDDYWQQAHTAHGELQIYNDNRVVGDLHALNGEDVDGVNANHFIGYADIVNQKDGTSEGVGVSAKLDFSVSVGDDGSESELFEGSALLSRRENGADIEAICATVSGMTTVDGVGFGMAATAALEVPGTATLVADATLEQAEYEDIPFAGGQAIDLTQLDEAKKDTIKKEVAIQAAKMSLSMITKPGLLASLTKLFTK